MAARGDEVDSSGSPCWAFPLAELNPRSEWTKVGEGSFGNVFKASLLGVPVAVKEAASTKESRLDGIRRDIFYLSKHPHPNIVQAIGAWEARDGKLLVVMEFMAHSLRVKRTVNKVDLVGALADVARALVRLHSAGHIHRDVKARNVLVSADYKVAKLADFGLARPLVRRPSRHDSSSGDDAQGEGGMTPRIGPRKYRAPEVEAGKAYGTQVDMYSYGVMIRELLEQLKGRRVRRYGASYDFLRALGRCCMREEPAARPTALDALACLQHHQGAPLHAGAWGGAPLGRVAAALLQAPPPSRAGDSGRKRKRSKSRDRDRERERDSTDGSSSSSESIDRLVRLALVRGGHALDESDSDADD